MTLGPDTSLLLPIGVVVTVLIAMVIATWRAANFMRDQRDATLAMQHELQMMRLENFTRRDFERWLRRFEQANRELNIPELTPSDTESGG